MSSEIPGPQEEADGALRRILEGIASSAFDKLRSLFGPIEESGITPEQFDALREELKDVDDPVERARKVYDFHKLHSPDTRLPDEFEDWLNKGQS